MTIGVGRVSQLISLPGRLFLSFNTLVYYVRRCSQTVIIDFVGRRLRLISSTPTVERLVCRRIDNQSKVAFRRRHSLLEDPTVKPVATKRGPVRVRGRSRLLTLRLSSLSGPKPRIRDRSPPRADSWRRVSATTFGCRAHSPKRPLRSVTCSSRPDPSTTAASPTSTPPQLRPAKRAAARKRPAPSPKAQTCCAAPPSTANTASCPPFWTGQKAVCDFLPPARCPKRLVARSTDPPLSSRRRRNRRHCPSTVSSTTGRPSHPPGRPRAPSTSSGDPTTTKSSTSSR